MTVGDRAQQALRWLVARSPRTFLFAGWILFVLGCYPGYLSTDSILQLYTVRSGDYSDYSPVMTALWGALEYVAAGPFPMLVLQSGLFLFGLHAILRTLLTPRAAAVTAACVLLFPPVFSTMAVIWPEPLMAGALLAAVGALLDPRRTSRITGVVLLAIAIACRPEIVLAVVPLVLLVTPPSTWWRRAGIALGVTLGLAIVAHVADWALTVDDTHAWEQKLMTMDVVGTLRRAKVKDEATVQRAFAGLPLADPATLRDRLLASNDAINWRPVSFGEKRLLEPIETDAQADALSATWRHTIAAHPGSYLVHRWAVTRGVLGISGASKPIYDDFGSVGLMAPLHHRALASNWEYGMQRFVRAVGKTPLFRPLIYFVLAIVAIVLARKRPVLRALAISGLVCELTMALCAPGTEYRFSHWLVATSCIALGALAVARRWAVPRQLDA